MEKLKKQNKKLNLSNKILLVYKHHLLFYTISLGEQIMGFVLINIYLKLKMAIKEKVCLLEMN